MKCSLQPDQRRGTPRAARRGEELKAGGDDALALAQPPTSTGTPLRCLCRSSLEACCLLRASEPRPRVSTCAGYR
ncbi:hypothetical protein EYF80_010668 [Liparis tanakae]|uniref:Uncharacterized protein n=1 Tax=Liparis tanakae TaxID=230148 RepID=A0A4Z2ILT3_9TELE|nr:hypothetical protein EYF80_010668 [Liparis tanakae]